MTKPGVFPTHDEWEANLYGTPVTRYCVKCGRETPHLATDRYEVCCYALTAHALDESPSP